MNDETISRILTQYGYTDFTLMPLEKGYRNESHPFRLRSGPVYNLILYKREPGILTTIRNADRTADFAASASLPARQTVGSQIIRLQAGTWRKYGRIYTYLPGHTIPWEAYTMEHIKLLGKTMSDLHAAVLPLSVDGYPAVADQYTTIIKRMDGYFAETGGREAMGKKLGLRVRPRDFVQTLQGAKNLKHQQVLHMDFVRSNVLFAEEDEIRISGILDFEKTGIGHPLFDIARTLAFLLVDCKYKTEQQVRKYFLSSGYKRRGSQPFRPVVIKDNGQREDLLETLVELFLLYDFYKFLRHNPYETLPGNEHFMRTRGLLIDHGLVEVV